MIYAHVLSSDMDIEVLELFTEVMGVTDTVINKTRKRKPYSWSESRSLYNQGQKVRID